MILPSSSVATPTNANKNLYNGGAEWQNDYGDLPDLQQTFYRNYDAALGRWNSVDPMAESAESMSPYQYAGNNPIMFNDPFGNVWANGCIGKMQQHNAIADMQAWEQQQNGGLYGIDPGYAGYLAMASSSVIYNASDCTNDYYRATALQNIGFNVTGSTLDSSDGGKNGYGVSYYYIDSNGKLLLTVPNNEAGANADRWFVATSTDSGVKDPYEITRNDA